MWALRGGLPDRCWSRSGAPPGKKRLRSQHQPDMTQTRSGPRRTLLAPGDAFPPMTVAAAGGEPLDLPGAMSGRYGVILVREQV